MKSSLPLTYPTITCTPPTAGLLSILECHPEAEGWIYSNYIQLVSYHYPKDNLEVSLLPWFDSALYCSWITSSVLSRKMIKTLNSNIIDFIRTSMNNRNYLYTILNHQYLNGSSAYKDNYKFLHDTFICGYDDETGTIKIGDFYTGKFSFIDIPFENFQKAYETVYPEDDIVFIYGKDVALWRYTPGSKYYFDSALVKQTSEEFLNSKNTLLNLREITNPHHGAKFGLAVYDDIIEWLENIDKNGISGILKNLYILRAHKTMMLKRIKYMEKNNTLNNSNKLFALYTDLENALNRTISLTIKYSIIYDPALISKVLVILRDCQEHENACMVLFVKSIIVQTETYMPFWYSPENLLKL